jgi:uncharacterized protein involved in exopolysaccharide biosynthesis
MTGSQQNSSTSRDNAIDLRELFHVLWAGKWLVGGFAFAAVVLATIVAFMLPNVYRAEALLAPNNQEGTDGLSALAAQYGGLAALAGVELGGGDVDKTAIGLEILKSRKFISDFITRHDLLVPLMAAEGWDRVTGRLEVDSDKYDPASSSWVRKVRPPKSIVPSSQEAYEEFMDILSVSQDSKTGFVTLAVEHYSPTIAKQWVDWLVDDLNAYVMQQDVTEAEHAIQYLNRQIENTALAELRGVFFRLIEEQTKTVMLAKMSNEYLLKTLDPAVAPELRFKPRRPLIILLVGMLGGFLGVISQLIRSKNAAFREGAAK